MMTTEEINSGIRSDRTAFTAAADADFAAQLQRVADTIRENRKACPIILLSGPSGSGKTTTALMIEKLLDESGCETHTLSMDNYFVPLTPEEQELANRKKLDLESPARVDIPFLNAQLQRIIACEPTNIPKFDFVHNTRGDSGWILTRKPGELVILEGIHALNPDVITVPEDSTYRLYVSVRTRITAGDGMTLHPKKIRLLRRMLRDKLFRNRSLSATLSMFPNVQRGENQYIMPYKARANAHIDTFLPYEVSVYKALLQGELESLSGQPEIDDMRKVLNELDAIDASAVEKTALIREFIGGGQFAY